MGLASLEQELAHSHGGPLLAEAKLRRFQTEELAPALTTAPDCGKLRVAIVGSVQVFSLNVVGFCIELSRRD